MRRLLCSISLLATTLYVTGCGFTNDKILNVAPAGKGTHGTVHGGQAPVVGALVSVYAIGSPGPATLLASTISDSAGNFAFGGVGTSYTCGSLLAAKSPVPTQEASSAHPHSNSQTSSAQVRANGGATGALHARPATLPTSTDTYVYITAVGGDSGGGPNTSIALGAGLGKCIDAQNATVEINEVSTVVLANVVGNFVQNGTIQLGTFSNDPHQLNALEIGLTNTFQTIDDLATGNVNPNTVSTDGGTSITIDSAKIYSIANTIASCVNSADVILPTPGPSTACQTLFTDANYDGLNSFDTFTAALYMAYAPAQNVIPLYQLAGSKPPFTGLTTAPNDWSVGISYSTSAMGLAIYPSVIGGGSSSTIDLDSNSRVWFPSNKSGAVGIAYFDPTENTFNGPFGADATFPITLPQYVALDDPDQVAWVTDTHTAALLGVSTAPGSEGTILANTPFVDPYMGSSTVALGPLFVNSDQSVVINYDDSQAAPLQITYNPFGNTVVSQSDFTLQPTGMTINTTLGGTPGPDDPAAPAVIAATSDLSTACNLEFSSPTDGNFVFINQTGGFCLSGGVATTRYNSTNGNQDQVAAFATTNSFCSEILGAGEGTGGCNSIPEYLSSPEGVAVDGGNEIWFANRGNGSIFPIIGTYEDGGTPDYSLVSDRALLHGTGNGATMTEPTGIAVDRGGNIWVSNTNCTNTGDTTCVYTLSEVFATGYPTFTPLSLQAARLQGTTPPEGSTEGTGTPHPMLKGRPVARASILHK